LDPNENGCSLCNYDDYHSSLVDSSSFILGGGGGDHEAQKIKMIQEMIFYFFPSSQLIIAFLSNKDILTDLFFLLSTPIQKSI